RSVDYLGHVISTDGIKADPGKIDRIVNYKTPSSGDEVRSFLGLARYYRRFIKDFRSLAKPLTRITHKDLNLNFNEKFLLFTDACEYGIGAELVLPQTHDGQEHPIAYSSRQLTKAEMKYSTTEK
ncbi:Uncharacterized protein APZ42_001237, partial [Daphnia magna]